MAKAVALLSGGLDSMLAAKLVASQGVDVLGVHFLSVFNCGAKPGKKLSAKAVAANLGIPIRFVDFTEKQLEILRDPPHGFGSAANPCIDCHIAMLRRAAEIMNETGADFLVTGEVVGQRPMSQRTHALGIIDRETGLAGRILRPLSAKELAETLPEKEGLVDRNRLEGIKGRTRARQMALAKKFGLTSYPSPAGGCLLTDPEFGRRVRDQLEHGGLDLNTAHLLKVGRHYRLDDSTKAIVGRNHRENLVIKTFAREGDIVLELADMMGPTALLRGDTNKANLLIAAALTARSSKAKDMRKATLKARKPRSEDEGMLIEVTPAADDFAEALTLSKT